MVLVKNWLFFHLFSQGTQARNMCFTIFQNNKKTPFQAIKTRSSKRGYSKVTPRLCPKIGYFSIFSFLGNIGQENVPYYILEQKTPFQAIKTRGLKSRNIKMFPKGSVHGFGQKQAFFLFFFQVIKARKMCFTIFQKEKKPFQAIKTRSSKSRKIEIFPKVFHRKGILRYSSTRTRFCRLYKEEVQRVEQLRFFQRGSSMVLIKNCLFFHCFISRQFRPVKCR